MSSLRALSAALRERRVDPVDLAEQALDTLTNGKDKALLIDRLPERAQAEALASRKRLADGNPLSLLDGVPTAWKDLFDLSGRVTTAGSKVLKSAAPASRDADLVAAAARAGVVSIGTLNMTEFAYSGIGFNPHYGTPRNACGDASGPARIPGGSSSGSAVAVASGTLPFAIGTDTGGSIRAPASFNGIVGYKASTRRYPMTGVFPLSRTLDSMGPFAHSAADCALVDAVLRGEADWAIPGALVSELTVIVPTNVVLDGCEPAVQANFEAACQRLAKAGATIERQPFPAFDAALDIMARHGSIIGAEALWLHRNRVREPAASQLDRRVLKRILTASGMTATDLVAVLEVRDQAIAQAATQIGTGLVAFPATPHVAPELAPLLADDDRFFKTNANTLRNTVLGNFLNWCGVSLPSGNDATAMPTSFLLSAPHGRDEALLAAAIAIEPVVRAP